MRALGRALAVKTRRSQSPLLQLAPRRGKNGALQVVIETPRGCRNKFKFDEKLRVFRLNSVLPAGSVFPFDFGYVPGTKAQDGDPLDVLLFLDEAVFTGCVVESRLIGVLEAEQQEKGGKRERNDRLLAVACESSDHAWLKSAKDLEKHLLEEIEHFFVSYHELKGSRFTVLGYRGPATAKRLLKKAQMKGDR